MTNIWALVLATVVLCSVPGGVLLQQDGGLQCEFQDDGDYDCRNNSFTSVPENIPGNATVLHLDSNNLTVLGNDELLNKGGANIEKLYLRWNAIAKIEDEAFSGLTNLSDISLSNNNLTVFNKNIFNSNLNLKNLFLNSNPLQLPASDTVSLLNSASLSRLSLSYCGLNHISEGLFSKLPSLEYLFLLHNRLTTVNWSSIKHLDKLVRLNLRGNVISHVTCHKESVLPLRELNNMRPFPQSLNTSLDYSPKQIYLMGNPLTCDCCFSLMSYAIRKEGWLLYGTCETEQSIYSDIEAQEVLKQCYIDFMEEHNRTVAQLH